ncbi:MAG: molybdopterin oxidoreductase [Proteobacteria bacterium]|nr:molybdopterin oxidoreductase [Pseudomonadota bacterium]MBU1611619.1 molybdopterin oxidoreductase [Pseudomonadota bacterium]
MLNRRSFIQLSVGGTLGLLVTPAIWKATDDVSIWTQNWGWIPKLKKGAVEGVPAVSKLCPNGCAVRVMTVGGEAYGTAGDMDNPLSQGGICPVCANGVQMMNNPVRVTGPMKDGQPITWDEAAEILKGELDGAAGSVAVISGDDTGTANEVLSALAADGSYYMMPSAMGTATKAWNGLMGGEGQIGYDMAGSDLVVMIGAAALESYGTTVANQKAFDAARPTDADATTEFIYAGPMGGHTASVCDGFIPVNPAGMKAFALGLAYYLVMEGATIESADFGALKSMLASSYSPAQVEKATGAKSADIQTLARKLMQASAPVVLCDFGMSPSTVAAGIVVNLLLGRLNADGGMVALAELPTVVDGALDRVARFEKDIVGDLASGTFAPKLTLIYEANPAYNASEVMEKGGFTVAFSTWMDETAAKANLVLPNAHPYERDDDLANPFGVAATTYVASAPVAKPGYGSKSTADFLLSIADLGYETFAEVLEAKGSALVEGTVGTYSVSLAIDALGTEIMPGDGLQVAVYNNLMFGSAKVATTPHNPVGIRANELKGMDMFVKLNGATAAAQGLSEGDKVTLTGSGGECKALVHVSEDVMDGVVAVPEGFGHTEWDEFSRGKGDKVYGILAKNADGGSTSWAGTTVNIAK